MAGRGRGAGQGWSWSTAPSVHGLDNPGQQPTPGQLTQLVADFFTRSLATRALVSGRDGGR